MPRLAAREPRVLEEAHVEHRVARGALPPRRTSPSSDDAERRTRRGSSDRVQPSRRCLDDRRRAARSGPTIDSTAPTGSSLGVGRVLRRRDEEEARARAPIDDDRQVHEEDRAPVEVLEQEAAGERAERDADRRRRRPRRRSPGPARSVGKTLVMIDSVAGMMNAPPMPMNARVAMSWSAELASADSSEPRPKIARPICSAPRRPKRSPRLPAVSSRPRTRACRSRPSTAAGCCVGVRARATSVGIATLRIVLSSTITSRLKQRTARISHRRWYACSCTRSERLTIAALSRAVGRVRRSTPDHSETQPFRY